MKMLVILAMAACLWVGALWAVTGAEPQGIANASAAGGQAAGSALATIDYQQHVHTILAAKCLSCHSAERRSGGLSLAAYADALEGGRSGAAVRPGDSAGRLLATPHSPGGHTSTSGLCCRRRTIFTRLSQTGPPTSDPHSSSVSLPTMTGTPSIGSRSGTICCGMMKASTTTPRRHPARASARGYSRR